MKESGDKDWHSHTTVSTFFLTHSLLHSVLSHGLQSPRRTTINTDLELDRPILGHRLLLAHQSISLSRLTVFEPQPKHARLFPIVNHQIHTLTVLRISLGHQHLGKLDVVQNRSLKDVFRRTHTNHPRPILIFTDPSTQGRALFECADAVVLERSGLGLDDRVVFFVELLEEIRGDFLVAEFRGCRGGDAADGAFAGFVVARVEFVGAQEVDEVEAAVGVVLARFFLRKGPVAVGDGGEIGRAEEGVDRVGEGAGEAGDLFVSG